MAPFQSQSTALESPTLATKRVFKCINRTAITAVEPEMSFLLRNCSTSRASTLVISSCRILFIALTVKASKRLAVDFPEVIAQVLWFVIEEINGDEGEEAQDESEEGFLLPEGTDFKELE